MINLPEEIGVVVIGRNEGGRLKNCLQELVCQAERIVYVDSGSSDGSIEYSKSIGVDVVSLDMRIPFSAGRARNEGFQYLNDKYKNLKYFQFIDGDCEICEGWMLFAFTFLENNESCAVAAGRRHEKFPGESLYNLLCDIEWDTPIGETQSCGGDFLIRKEAFLQVSGFNPAVIAGEEPDMCYRLRQKEWSIYRLDHSMTLHDAAITRFPQWWKRAVRSGHAYAQGYSLHSKDGQGYYFKESLRSWLWGGGLPASVLILTIAIHRGYLLLPLVFLAQFLKITIYSNKRFKNKKKSMVYSFFTIIAKIPQFIGQLIFLKKKIFGSGYSIIEYN